MCDMAINETTYDLAIAEVEEKANLDAGAPVSHQSAKKCTPNCEWLLKISKGGTRQCPRKCSRQWTEH